MNTPNGKISYYVRGDFVAECKVPGHNRCTKTRKGQGASKMGPTLTGRPLGFLSAWLLTGHIHSDRFEHYDDLATTFTHESRLSHRADLAAFEGAADLFEKEDGEPGDGEPAESC